MVAGLSWQETILRLLLAAILGGLVGIERQRLEWAAGLRTHMLVCLGSSLIMMVSSFGFSDILGTPNVNLDPSRVAAQVVSGIGFLGAGTILFLKHEVVRGLTTAAGLWTVAGIGLAVGGGMYIAASAATALVLIVLVLVKPYKKKITRMTQPNEIYLAASKKEGILQYVEGVTEDNNLVVTDISIHHSDKNEIEQVYIKFSKNTDAGSLRSAIDAFNQMPGIQVVRCKIK